MKVVVKVTGPVVLPSGNTRTTVELEEGSTVAEVIEAVGFPAAQARFFRAAVGGEVAGSHTVLKDGDEVTLMVPVGGG